MRLIDADALFCAAFEIWGNEADGGETNLFMEMINHASTIAPPPNDPLTLEELREMDGEPVWVETTDIKKANRYAFVDVGCEVVRFFDTRCGVKCSVMGNHFSTYGNNWFAYRRKPEEGTA